VKVRWFFAAALTTAAYLIISGMALAAPTVGNYSTGNISTALADNTTTTSTINVADTGRAVDVNVSFRINHTFDSDLNITLISPDGTRVALTRGNGGGGDNFGSGNTDCTGTPTRFDDSAANPLDSQDPPFAGTFRPVGSLGALYKTTVQGNWTLEVVDTAVVDVGTLYCWSLRIARDTGPPTTAVISGAINHPFTLGLRVGAAWNATDASTAVTTYAARQYGFTPAGSFTGDFRFSYGSATSGSFTGAAGNSYCVYVRAWDRVDFMSQSLVNVHCTSIPLDDPALTHSAGWTQKSGVVGYYLKTYSQSKVNGATLTTGTVNARRLAVVVTKCPGCGRLQVSWGATVLGVINTNSTVLKKKQLVMFPDMGSVTAHTITLTVVSSGKPVRVEGLGIRTLPT
jgi:subtilisin-like proprotein convertase family protein